MANNTTPLDVQNDELISALIVAYRTMVRVEGVLFRQGGMGQQCVELALARDMAFEVLSKEKSYRDIKG